MFVVCNFSNRTTNLSKFVFPFFLLFSIVSCSNGTKVSKTLSFKTINRLVKKDSLWTHTINLIEYNQRVVIKDNRVKQAQFDKLTYEDVHQLLSFVTDYEWVTTKEIEATFEYGVYLDSIISLYQKEIDSTFLVHRLHYKDYDPSSFFDIEFASVRTNYYSYIGGVESVDIGFRITPLKGPIQGGAFKAFVISKLTESEVGILSGRFSGYFSKPNVKWWELNYELEEELEYLTSSQVRDRYDFEFTHLTARQGNINFSGFDILTEIPYNYLKVITMDELGREEYEDIIRDEYMVDLLEEDVFIENKIKYIIESIFSNPPAFQYISEAWSALENDDIDAYFVSDLFNQLEPLTNIFKD